MTGQDVTDITYFIKTEATTEYQNDKAVKAETFQVIPTEIITEKNGHLFAS